MRERKLIRVLTVLLALLVARLAMVNKESEETAVYGEGNVEQQEVQEEEQKEMGMSVTDAYPFLYATQPVQTEHNMEEKTVFLTFDDGPSRNTEKVLDILKQYDIKATFFVIGMNLTEDGILCLKRAVEEGHVIGLHTETHDYKKLYASLSGFLSDYHKLSERLLEVLGECPALFRFPGGSYNMYAKKTKEEIAEEMERRGFVYYDWNVSGEDSVGTPTAYSIKSNIFPAVYEQKQPVILLHDSASTSLTVEVLPSIIEELQKAGYTFDTLDHREPCQFSW